MEQLSQDHTAMSSVSGAHVVGPSSGPVGAEMLSPVSPRFLSLFGLSLNRQCLSFQNLLI